MVLELRRKLRYGKGPTTAWADAQQACEDVMADILVRHVRGDQGYGFRPEDCGWCSEDCACGHLAVAWPCPEVCAVLDAVAPTQKQ